MVGEKKKQVAWKVAATYIGTVVGAGFASGQEVLQYFGFFGYWGIFGLLIAAFLFYYFGKQILWLGKELKAESHVPIIYHVGGKKVGRVLDYIITFFLFGALTTMAAGAGAIFQEQFNLPVFWGNIVMIVATLLTVLTGISGVINAISFVVPVLMIAVFGISFYIVFQQGVFIASQGFVGNPAVPGWPLSAIVYVSYNLVMAVAVLGPLGNEAKDFASIKKGALWGSVGLGLGAAAILWAVFVTLPQSGRYAVPMIYVAGLLSPLVQQLYSLVLFAEIYTTAVGSLFGFIMRLSAHKSVRAKRYITVSACLGALIASRVGFTDLVRTLFSIVGYAGLLLLGSILYRGLRDRKVGLIPQALYRKGPDSKTKDDKKNDSEE